ncbi:hypothetical protein GEMRC1_012591 [Eukaryota sp. GEM-RC1]
MSLLVQLNHPAVLRVYGLSYWEDRIGIVMERASSSLPCPNSFSSVTVEYAKQLCHGISYLHSKSVVHGDVKPENVLIVDDRIRIADFGTSRNIASTSTVPNPEALTVRYAAPEQFNNTVSPQSDVYSIGVVLYELFQNKEAFEGMNFYGIVGAKQRGVPLSFDSTIPDTLANVISRCLMTDPVQRPEIDELIEVLENLSVSKEQDLIEIYDPPLSEPLVTFESFPNSFNNSTLSENTTETLIKYTTNLSNASPSIQEIPENKQNINHSIPLQTEQCSTLEPELQKVLAEIKENRAPTTTLNGKSVGIEGVRALVGVLKVNNSVTNVNLRFNSIDAVGATALAELFKVNTVLTNIDLYGNRIKDEGATALADALTINTRLTSVALANNSIGNIGASALAKALTVNNTLTNLNLYGNSIGNSGAIELAKALTINTTLKYLNLYGNCVENVGAIALAKALTVNNTLTSLSLRGNCIELKGMRALAEALKVNPNLTVEGIDLSRGQSKIKSLCKRSLVMFLICIVCISFLTKYQFGTFIQNVNN